MNSRMKFIVIKNFEDSLAMGISDVVYRYVVGDIVTLRVDGKVAKKWIEKGYIKALQS